MIIVGVYIYHVYMMLNTQVYVMFGFGRCFSFNVHYILNVLTNCLLSINNFT